MKTRRITEEELNSYADGKSDGLYKMLSKYSGVDKKTCRKVIGALHDAIYDQMVAGNEVSIYGLCEFYTSKMPSKKGIDFNGNERVFKEGITVRCRIKPNFKIRFKNAKMNES